MSSGPGSFCNRSIEQLLQIYPTLNVLDNCPICLEDNSCRYVAIGYHKRNGT